MDTTTSPRSGLTVERLLQAKGLLDRAEVEEEIIDVYNSLPLRFATEFPRDTREDHEPC